MSNKDFWSTKSVWINGASSGIGEALAYELASLGATVHLSARSLDKLKLVEQKIKDSGGKANTFQLDVTDSSAFSEIPKNTLEVDMLVYCAGNYFPTQISDFDSQKYCELIDVNLCGLFRTLEILLPRMIQRKSGIICGVSSVVGYRGTPYASVYGASKAAMTNFLESIRFELDPKGIDVAIVHPGFVDTPLTEKNTFFMPFLIEPEEAAQAIRFGLENGSWEIHFPKRFTYLLKVLRILPFQIYHMLTKRLIRKGES